MRAASPARTPRSPPVIATATASPSPTTSATSPARSARPPRSTPTRRTPPIDSSPADPSSNTTPELQLQLHRKRLELRVPRRRRQLDAPAPAPTPISPALARGQPHLRGARHRRGRQHRRHPGQLHLDGRPDRAEHRRSTPARPTRPNNTTPSFTLQLLRGRLDASSAASTAAAGPPAPAPTPISPALAEGSHTFDVRGDRRSRQRRRHAGQPHLAHRHRRPDRHDHGSHDAI